MANGDLMLGARDGETCYVAVQGLATALQCTALRQFVLAALGDGATCVQVDLSRCEYGDSTFVGTLLQFRQACESLGPDALVLLSPTSELHSALSTMGLCRLFTIAAGTIPGTVAWQRLATEERGRCSTDFRHNVAKAHRLLANSSDTCRERYQHIADAAEQELQQRKTSPR